jgi:hypothetical protein
MDEGELQLELQLEVIHCVPSSVVSARAIS